MLRSLSLTQLPHWRGSCKGCWCLRPRNSQRDMCGLTLGNRYWEWHCLLDKEILHTTYGYLSVPRLTGTIIENLIKTKTFWSKNTLKGFGIQILILCRAPNSLSSSCQAQQTPCNLLLSILMDQMLAAAGRLKLEWSLVWHCGGIRALFGALQSL